MRSIPRRTVRNGIVGGVVGAVLGVVPLVLLVAPLLGGGVAGYLERDDARGGAVAGVLAGVVTALFGVVLTAVVVAVRFGDLPLSVVDGPLARLGIATALSLAAVVGQVLVAGIGGALGGILEAAHRPSGSGDARRTASRVRRRRSPIAAVGSVLGGLVTFAAVAYAVTAVLDPLIWPSAIVGLPVGFVAGVAVAVVGYAFARRERNADGRWRAVGIGALAIVVVFGLLLGGLWIVGQERVAASHESTYEYEVSIDADGTLEDPTFYVPAPTDSDDVRLSAVFVEDASEERYVPGVASGAGAEPVNFSSEVVETEHGPMIAVSADRIEVSRYYYRTVENETMGWTEPISPEEYDPADPSTGVAHDGSFTLTVTAVAEDSIDTADPFGTEPLLAPQYDRTRVDCPSGPSETRRCYTYESRVYADYDADEGTTVSVAATVDGRNEWFSGGWNGNEYRDRTSVELLGPRSGWHVAFGELDVGRGSYRR
jgi:hypothetical protein